MLKSLKSAEYSRFLWDFFEVRYVHVVDKRIIGCRADRNEFRMILAGRLSGEMAKDDCRICEIEGRPTDFLPGHCTNDKFDLSDASYLEIPPSNLG
jgi:hypothetical protein